MCLAAGGCTLLAPPAPPDRSTAVPSAQAVAGAPEPSLSLEGMESDDLLTRLRRGFRLPELDDAEIRERENHYRAHPGALDQLADPGAWYLPYIAREVARRAMPAEIALLPAVESGFDATARSPSGAAGLWQFTGPTARHFGLFQGSWLDQRMNLEASTRAALDYLEHLADSFDGDWLLALAAYNAGEGTVKNLLDDNRRRGIKADFAHLPLPAETRRFVPRLIALRNVIRDPARYGVTLPRIEDRIRFARVEADAQVHHHHVAALCGIDEALVRQINAGQLRGATPPMGPHRVRLPGACASRIDVARLVAQPLAAPPAADGDTATYEVRRGDNLWNVARRHGISLAALTHANPGIGPVLAPGERLRIPAAVGAGDDEIVHHVRRGDTLYDLARRYGVTIASITRVNRIRPDSTLHPGQPLRIRTGP